MLVVSVSSSGVYTHCVGAFVDVCMAVDVWYGWLWAVG